jgi:hypothetical protein
MLPFVWANCCPARCKKIVTVKVEKKCPLPPLPKSDDINFDIDCTKKHKVCFDKKQALKLEKKLRALFLWIKRVQARCGNG